MIDEADISEERKWFHRERARAVVASLQKNNTNAQYVSNRKEALPLLIDMIPPGVTVARGDSITIDQIGIILELKKRNKNRIIDPFERDSDGQYVVHEVEDRKKIVRETFSADIFMVGSNAVTLDGKLVNTDGWGNRVAAMIFGPDKVIVTIGVNKIVSNVDEALERIRNVAAPINARRHYLKHHRTEFGDLPCVRTGRCVDCNHDWSICHHTVITKGTTIREKDRINVIIIGEELGI